MSSKKPYEIFPRRIISHSEAQDRLMQVALNPDQIQSRADEILARKGTFFGHRVAYVHIPFCEKLCKFCTFFRVPKDEQKVAPFMDALMESIRRFGEAPYVRSVPFEAVYFGGGTPTTISADQIRLLTQTIRESLPLAEDVEFTSESTFANITDEMLEALREEGVNRMSLGVQTFSPRLRNLIGRECHPDDVIEKIEKVRRVMPVVNLDLIYNFPRGRWYIRPPSHSGG
jgi:oxygen-independent coproporphyrinogen-3 oxidase